MDTIVLDQVTKTFGTCRAVDDLSLTVPRGSMYGFIGPNGSGKTTTLRMIMNILYPDRGEIQVFGERLQGACVDRIGYMPEERGLYKRMKLRELLCFYGLLKKGQSVRSEVDLWLERFHLADWANKKLETLSKGMSQKVQFIATVVANPDIVILDEPFSGLDPVNAEALREAVLDLQKQGTTVIFSTHDMAMAERMCDFIFMIHRGKKVLDGTLASIQNQYRQDTVRVCTDQGMAVLTDLPGVDRVNDFGQVQELRVSHDCDAQAVLTLLLSRAKVLSFEMVKPSLHDIFIRIAGDEATGETDA
ncbi:ABC transporter ATP-binding protein [Planctomycetota bacterium]